METRPDIDNYTLKLFEAVEQNDFALVQKYVFLGVDLSMKLDGKTVMELAVSKKYFYIIKHIAENIKADAGDLYGYGYKLVHAVKND
jgi:hypothetical protein